MSTENIEGAPHWRLCRSRRTGKQYLFNWHNNTSLWVCSEKDPLGRLAGGGAGWGFVTDKGGTPTRAINIFSKETRPADAIIQAIAAGNPPIPRITEPAAGQKRPPPVDTQVQPPSSAARTESRQHPRGMNQQDTTRLGATASGSQPPEKATKFGSEPPETPLPQLPIEWYRRGWPDDKNAAIELAARNEKLRQRGKSVPGTSSDLPAESSFSVPVGSSTGSELSAMASPYTGVKHPPDVSHDERVFGEAHRRVLQQVLKAAPKKTIFDIGAGTGLSTRWILESCPQAQVFAIDLWHSPFAGDQLRAHGHGELASALGAVPRAYEAFCLGLDDDAAKVAGAGAGAGAGLLPSGSPSSTSSMGMGLGGLSSFDSGEGRAGSKASSSSSSSSSAAAAATTEGAASSGSATVAPTARQRLVPMRYPMHAALRHLRSIGQSPDAVYLDADLDHGRCKDVLNFIMEFFPGAHIVGGGWALSAGVRRAVCEVVVEKSRLLHVERGLCWTLSAPLVRQTANKPEDAAKLAALLGSESKGSHKAALTAVNFVMRTEALLAKGDDVEALRKLCEGRGRSPETALRFRDRTLPGTLPGEDSSVYIDTSGNDKRCYTPLMRAVNHRRGLCATFLLREAGARVNVQAPRSLQTALHLAAYKGDKDLIDLLLAAGASRVLKNKWGETPAITAIKGGKHELAALLKESRS